jgi:hypothetical protein
VGRPRATSAPRLNQDGAIAKSSCSAHRPTGIVADVKNEPSVEIVNALTANGYSPGRVMGAGMEGVVLDLGDGLVAKTWHSRRPEQLERLRLFYATVAGSGLPLATPKIIRILDVGRQRATIERKLHGRPLREEMSDGSYFLADADVNCVVAVLSALRAATPAAGMSSLPIFAGEVAFDASTSFGASLADLIERRTRRFSGALALHIPDLERMVDSVTSHLRSCDPVEPALIHGDLIPANILVDDSGAPTGILDFGFFSTLGDPRFDAAVAASIHDMYGTRAATNEAIIDDAVMAEFGYDRPKLHMYRAAYALATGNCFSTSGSDGHFAWCAAMMNRPDVREALGV